MSRARIAVSTDARTILSDAAILQQVFSFLPGDWLYLGGVCHAWMQSYKHMPDSSCALLIINNAMSTCDMASSIKTVTCDSCTTLIRAAFQSCSRLKMAAACGLQLRRLSDDVHYYYKLQYIAGLVAGQATLTVAEELGVKPGCHTVLGAADAGHDSILNSLVQVRECTLPLHVGDHAASTGNIDMLKCLKHNGCTFTRALCSKAAHAG
jgi:hypothetical protein